MRTDFVLRVLLVEKQVSDVGSGGEMQNVEIVDILWVILQQEHEVVVLEVVDLELLDGLLHVVVELGFFILAQHVAHLL